MSDIVSISTRLAKLDVAPRFENYSKVVIRISDDTEVSAGDDTGRELKFDCPWGTQQMARNILTSLRGFQYQPYTAGDVQLDPAAEIGDGANIRGNYGGIYTRSRTFGRLMKSNISAPYDEEIDHEYKFKSEQERKFARQIADVRASLIIQADNIMAEVVKKEDGNTSSFGWKLLSDSWKVYSNGTPVLSVDRNGLEIAGTIKAGTKIGSSGGFNISASAIWNNISSFGGSQSSGVYIGVDGIQLGQGFKVDRNGNLTASSGTFTGAVNAGSIRYGGSAGTLHGGGIRSGTIGTGSGSALTSSAITGINGGTNFENMTTRNYTATWVMCNHIAIGGYAARWKSAIVKNGNGTNITIHYLGWDD